MNSIPTGIGTNETQLSNTFPDFRLDKKGLRAGCLCFYGELLIRPEGGTKRHPVKVYYPPSTPFRAPIVIPIESLPEFDEEGGIKTAATEKFFDRRHQMPSGALCLFQEETRGEQGGEWICITDVLRRAKDWFVGYHTGHWPPDSHESELEPHFFSVGDVLLSSTFYSSEISGSGKFHMVRDARRVFDGVGEAAPFIVTAFTESGDLKAVRDAREELINIYPWISSKAWSPAQLAEREAESATDEDFNLLVEHGYWWALSREPQPFRDGRGLLRELADAADKGDAWKMLSEKLGDGAKHV